MEQLIMSKRIIYLKSQQADSDRQSNCLTAFDTSETDRPGKLLSNQPNSCRFEKFRLSAFKLVNSRSGAREFLAHSISPIEILRNPGVSKENYTNKN
uniref:Uncharacterized protein n=1 Tax=Romanomermis culicivorax TaxID=13658 RepID=A0A915L2C9_ROMCU